MRGRGIGTAAFRLLLKALVVTLLTPLICPSGIFSPLGRREIISNYRVKLCALPASTLMILPVDLAERSEARK